MPPATFIKSNATNRVVFRIPYISNHDGTTNDMTNSKTRAENDNNIGASISESLLLCFRFKRACRNTI